MPIKNKDGTEYKLQGPNKIMKEQSFWNQKFVSLFNMNYWKEVVYKDQQVTPLKVMDEFMARLSPNEVTFEQIKSKQEPETVVFPPETVILPPVVKKEIHESLVTQNEKIALRKQTFFCVPINYQKHIDDLYGDETVEAVMGKRFTFEGVPIENNDLIFIFWTKNKLENGSIVFQPGVERHARWWQVQKTEPDSDGFITTTIISSINPDFSD